MDSLENLKTIIQKNEKIAGIFIFGVAVYIFYKLGSNFGEFLYYLSH